jgi:hypothetical protein
VVACVAAFLPQVVPASLVVEDFTYPAGQLLGRTGGTNWGGQWGASTGVGGNTSKITVSNTVNLTTSVGGYAVAQDGVGSAVPIYNQFRGINRTIDANLGGAVWFSILVQNTAAGDHTGIQFNNHADSPFAGSDYVVGPWHVELAGTSLHVRYDGTVVSNLATLALNTTHLLLGRIDIGAGTDRMQVWADPADLTSIGAPLFDANSADMGANLYLAGIFGYGANPGDARSGYMDALRLSDGPQAFTDVTGVVPEPATAMTLLGGLLLLRLGTGLCRCRRM